MRRAFAMLCLGATGGMWGCGLELDPPAEIIHARFDPDEKVVPMPTDILRDEALGHLDIPIEDDLTPAEQELYTALNLMDGWSSAMAAKVELTGAIDRASVTPDTLQVWHWRETPERVDGATVTISEDERELTIDAPRTGWERGGTYVVMMRGGEAGVEGKAGERVECDAAFYFMRQTERLDVPEHERAFPGDTAAARRDKAIEAEEVRSELLPFFDFFEGRGIARDEVAALWSFTITERVELAMDKASQRMPLPLDLLLDPDTGRVDLPPASWDTETVAHAKEQLRAYDGFAISANLQFGFTGPVDPATITPATVELWRIAGPDGAGLARIDAEVALLADGINVEVLPQEQLDERSRYGVVVREGVRASDGTAIALMPAGHLMRAAASVVVDGESQVDGLPVADARRMEAVRTAVGPFLDELAAADPPEAGAGEVLAAWTYTTMSIDAPMESWVLQPAELGVAVDPANIVHQTPGQAALEFPLGIASLFSVADVYHGTIASPVFLDRETRAMRADGGHEVQDIAFTMTVPRGVSADEPLPVVIFGHAIMTERRMVLAIGDALASRGFAAISIDLPFHGTRAYCWSEGPLTVPDPTTGELTSVLEPCSAGACQEDGRCVDANGVEHPLALWPVIPMPTASGAAFIEIERIANTRDHFIQSVIDLNALLRSLREGDWASVTGAPFDPERIYYAGQSLGGILGATFVAMAPDVGTTVLNVPGADTVDLFRESPFFGGQVDAFFRREGVEQESFDGHRFLNVARWFMDAADPASFADRLMHGRGGPRDVMIQMATLDFIIPNDYTRKLEALSGAPRRDYIAEHAFLVIPIEPEYLRGANELASFFSGELAP
jgi:pimeloyl-ACP methyl ester carboxylesterase